jgi:hypothetical protein
VTTPHVFPNRISGLVLKRHYSYCAFAHIKNIDLSAMIRQHRLHESCVLERGVPSVFSPYSPLRYVILNPPT